MKKLYLAALLAMVPQVMAAEVEVEDDTDLPEWAIEKIAPMHDSLSDWITHNSRNIDGFFGSEDNMRVENDSYLRLSQELDWSETGGFEAETGVRFRLDLPTSKKRLRFIIESDPEESEGTLAEQASNRLSNDQRGLGSTILGLSRLSKKDKTEAWNLRAGAGVKVRWPPDPYVRFTGERLWDLNSPWQLESYNRASWFNEEGYSIRSKWDIGRPLDENHHLRFITNFQWQEEEADTLEYSEGVEINQLLGPRSVMRYAAVAVGRSASDPRLHDYYFYTQYRRNLHRNILFIDLIPELHFPHAQDHDPEFSVTLRFEMMFKGDLEFRR
ncbi:hypothetical protein [Oceanisphaera sp. IT1-181]|uniref:hypothetical protein n=1 Tax=Oceanisphaera sp. IT1-181 TaxID=3081199 RepID=UPI0029C9C75E|nr:hypothetical protein [Oceanisphaera sp. IT1-181]